MKTQKAIQMAGSVSTNIAVVERRTWWTAELQRQFQDTAATVRQFVSIPSLVKQHEFAAALTIVVWSHPETGITNLVEGQLNKLAERISTILIMDSKELPYEWVFREIGCIDVIVPPVTGPELARLIKKYNYVQPVEILAE